MNFGSQYSMRVWLNPGRLTDYKLTVSDVMAALRSYNVEVSAGQFGGTPAVKGQRMNVSIVVQNLLKTPEEFESYFPSLYLDIGLDGVVLYDRDGYTARKIERVREIIDQTGLFREPDNGNWYWDWKQPPEPRWEITWEGFRELA